ncbi:MAG: molecular chaperone [Comamonas sp.]
MKLRHALWSVLLAVPTWALAIGLQISPTSLQLAASQNADGIWLSNVGETVISAQARVFLWTQQDEDDRLAPSTGLIVSPPMLQIPPGGKQFVRVIRSGPPPAAETAYRVIIDELPVEAPPAEGAAPSARPPSQKQMGLSFVMRYSLPVFLAGEAAAAPQLAWSVRKSATQWQLQVRNTGSSRARIADVQAVLADGSRATLHGGLLGYALAGQTMHWNLPAPAPAIRQPVTGYEALVNYEVMPLHATDSAQP